MSGGKEAFYIDENGQKQDGDIHHPILDAVDDTHLRRKAYLRTVALGVDPAAAARFYGLEEGYDLSEEGPSSLR